MESFYIILKNQETQVTESLMISSMNKKIIIYDGDDVLHRVLNAFHTLPSLIPYNNRVR